MIYKILIMGPPTTLDGEWQMQLYRTVPGKPDEIVMHERTDRAYDSPMDCCTSARHLIREIEKGRS